MRTTPDYPVACHTADGLRVLFVVDSWFPGVGGAELQSLKLANVMRENGAHIDFVAPHLEPETPVRQKVEGFDLQKFTYPAVRGLGSIVLNLKFAHFLWKHRQQYDAIHIHVTGVMAMTAGYMRPLVGKPMVAKVSGYFEFEHGVLRRTTGFSPFLALSRMGLRQIDYIQTISRQTRERLLEAGFKPRQIRYIPNGIELNHEARTRRVNESEFRIGYCGRMRAIKGVDVLINAFHQVLQQQPELPIRLVIAGDGETEAEMHTLVDTLGIGERVDFLGEIKAVDEFLADLDVYVQPSYAEGLPNSVIEAMNASLPILATDIGGNRDLVSDGENGFLFEPGNTDSLAVLIVNAFQERQGMATMGKASRERIEAFGFNRIVGELSELYSNEAK